MGSTVYSIVLGEERFLRGLGGVAAYKRLPIYERMTLGKRSALGKNLDGKGKMHATQQVKQEKGIVS